MKKYNVVMGCMGLMIPGFPEPQRGANFKGGLEILAGDIPGVTKIVPLYNRYWAKLQSGLVHYGYDNVARVLFDLDVPALGDRGKNIKVYGFRQNQDACFGISHPIFDFLYGEDRWQRMQQEVLMGHVIPALLRKINNVPDILWLNESHLAVSFAVINEDPFFADTAPIFTVHTPVDAGNEKFPADWFNQLRVHEKYRPIYIPSNCIDFTKAAIAMSRKTNGVSIQHGQVTRRLYPDYADKITGITNGVNFDHWRSDGLKKAIAGGNMSFEKLSKINFYDKEKYLSLIYRRTGVSLDMNKLLISAVRRIEVYKQQHTVLAPVIKAVCANRGTKVNTTYGLLEGLGAQVFCAGHTADSNTTCKKWIGEFFDWMSYHDLKNRFVFSETYDFELLKLACAGPDLGLHVPQAEAESCGTSTRRRFLHGVPSLSTLVGGDMQIIEDYKPETGTGNSFIVSFTDTPLSFYKKAKIASDLYYKWKEKGDPAWLELRLRVFEAGLKVGVDTMMDSYDKEMFEPLVEGKK